MDIPRPIRDRLKAKAHARRGLLALELMDRHGATEEQAFAIVAKVEAEHPILDWINKIDWATVLALALKFLPLILAVKSESEASTPTAAA